MRLLACVLILATSISTALADDTESSTELRDLPVAIGVNSPIGWLKDKDRSFGVSAYVGFGRHHAVRANYASYAEDGPTLAFIGEIMGGEAASYAGTIEDLGLSYVWYPRRLWSGPTFELGVLRRRRETSFQAEFDDKVETDTVNYGARGMVGWSWQLPHHAYIAVAIGLSVGRERGSEVRTPEIGTMPTTSSVDRAGIDTEGYLRLGFAFGR